MKKLYTLFTFLFVAMSICAQSFTVKVAGNEVVNGQTINLAYDQVPVTWIVPNVVGTYTIDPEIKVVSDTEQKIYITISDDVKDGYLQNCAFGSCSPVTENNCPVEASGTAKVGEFDAAIHIAYGSNKPADNIQRSFNVKISNGDKTIEFTVVVNVGSYATSIAKVNTENASAKVYGINGSVVNANAVTGKVYIRNGKKYISK